MKNQKYVVNQYLIESVAQFDDLLKRRRELMAAKVAAITTVCDLAIDPLALEQDHKNYGSPQTKPRRRLG